MPDKSEIDKKKLKKKGARQFTLQTVMCAQINLLVMLYVTTYMNISFKMCFYNVEPLCIYFC